MPRTVIFYLDVGSGHRQAAEAICEALEAVPGWTCAPFDLLDAVSPTLPALFDRATGLILEHAPETYQRLWGDVEFSQTFAESPAFRYMAGRLGEVLADQKPDLCVATHAFAARLLAACRSQGQCRRPIVNVVTDLMLNGFWPVNGSDAFVVASRDAHRQLRERGYPEAHIHVLGIPLRAEFSQAPDSAANVRLELGITTGRLVTALVGGSHPGPYAAIAGQMEALLPRLVLPDDVTLALLTGGDERAASALSRAARQAPYPIRLLDRVENVATWYAASDLLISKPGGLTVAEALSCGLPLVLMGAGAGQETANAALLQVHGCAVYMASAYQAAVAIPALLAEPARLEAMRAACRAMGQPRAAAGVVDLLRSLAGHPSTGTDLASATSPPVVSA